MIKKWVYSKIDNKKIDEVAEKNNISKLLAKIVLSRGIEEDEIPKFLKPNFS